jgi:hypothetical protein
MVEGLIILIVLGVGVQEMYTATVNRTKISLWKFS